MIHGTADLIDLPLLKRSNEIGKPIKIQGEIYRLKKIISFIDSRAIKVSGFKSGNYASEGWETE